MKSGAKVKMNLRSIRWRLPFSYALIALLAALALGSVMLLVLSGYYARQEQAYLLGNAQAIQPLVEQALQPDSAQGASLQQMINGLAFLSQTRIRILDSQGKMVVDSGVPDSNQVVALSGLPAGTFILSTTGETSAGTAVVSGSVGQIGGVTPSENVVVGGVPDAQISTTLPVSASPYGYAISSTSTSGTLRRSSQKVTLPLSASLGMLEMSNGPAYGWEILRSVSLAWAGAGLVATLLAGLAGWFASRRFTHPVLALTDTTLRMEAGNLSTRAALPGKHQAAEFQTLAHSFNAMAQRVENTVSTLRAFVADAAHELRTPLTALHTNLELARQEPDASRQSLYLEAAQKQSARMEALVGGLLDLSRIDAIRNDPVSAMLDLKPLLARLGEQFASQAEQAGRNFSITLPPDPINFRGNVSQITCAIVNLFENSLKFTPAGGSIAILLKCQDGEIVLTIVDDGIGISPEDLVHLFERFHRGRNAASYPGSGLGLAIVKAIVSAHGGNITAESQLGQGTRMILRLPVVE
jgi:signal transduction histidine kinase